MTSKQLFCLGLIVLIFTSCSHGKRTISTNGLSHYKKRYSIQDKSGEFSLVRESGLAKSNKSYATKMQILDKVNSKVLEKSIVFSAPENIKKDVLVLTPIISEYQAWFDGKMYRSKMSLDIKSKSLVVDLKSPESQWNGKKSYQIPNGNGVICYFSQVIDCAKRIGFLKRAIESKSGAMTFHLLWEGYPYIQEQYANIKSHPFALATLKYDGKNTLGETRFTLSLENNLIFYFIDNNFNLDKMFWPAQGVSVVVDK